jgi:signal transduction histidine kinase
VNVEWPDDLLAVMAHSLLNSVGVISGAAETMKIHWGRLDDSIKIELLEKIIQQSALVTGVLGDLVRSGRPELVQALNELHPPDPAGS